ncbi:MAG: MATE family efflux transporter [Planctomycetota bacterium]
MASPLRQEYGSLFRLAVPVATVNLLLMAMGLVDTAMVGFLDEGAGRALAAVGVGGLLFMLVHHVGLGVLLALDPLLSQALGARDEPRFRLGLQRGFVLAALWSLPSMALLVPAGTWLELLAQDADVIPGARTYVLWSIPGLMPMLGFQVLRISLQSMHRLRPLLLMLVLANLLNALLDWLLIYGRWGFPALGIEGAALASTLCRWFQFACTMLFAWPLFRPYLRGSWRRAFAPGPLLRTVRLGLPLGGQITAEFLAFASVMLFMGWIGEDAQAAHQVTINLAAFAFMLPLGLGMAASVRCGHAVGRGDAEGLRRSVQAALGMSLLTMLASMLCFLLVPQLLAALFTDDGEVLAVAVQLIVIAGLFQLGDGIQVVAAGCLRGMGDTHGPLLVNLLGFWLCGAPCGLLLAFPALRAGRLGWPLDDAGADPTGLWWGLAVGLFVVAAVLVLRIALRLRRDVVRVSVD